MLNKVITLTITVCLVGIIPVTAQIPITYHFTPVVGIKALRETYSSHDLFILQKLNRTDLDHLLRLKEMVVPEQWYYNELMYSPLPDSYAWAAQYAKAIVVHQPDQVFGAYENGRLVRWGPISSGRKAVPTPTGLYHLKGSSLFQVGNPKLSLPAIR